MIGLNHDSTPIDPLIRNWGNLLLDNTLLLHRYYKKQLEKIRITCTSSLYSCRYQRRFDARTFLFLRIDFARSAWGVYYSIFQHKAVQHYSRMQNPAVNTLGYSSNLNQSQKATLEEHQRLIATELPAMADTRTCLRYLRSTSFDAKKAADMMRKTAVRDTSLSSPNTKKKKHYLEMERRKCGGLSTWNLGSNGKLLHLSKLLSWKHPQNWSMGNACVFRKNWNIRSARNAQWSSWNRSYKVSHQQDGNTRAKASVHTRNDESSSKSILERRRWKPRLGDTLKKGASLFKIWRD